MRAIDQIDRVTEFELTWALELGASGCPFRPLCGGTVLDQVSFRALFERPFSFAELQGNARRLGSTAIYWIGKVDLEHSLGLALVDIEKLNREL